MAADTTLNVRITGDVKIKAAAILAASGLSTSVAVRMFLMRVIGGAVDLVDTYNLDRVSRKGSTNDKALSAGVSR